MNISKILKVISALIAISGAYAGYQLGSTFVLHSQDFNYMISILIWIATFIVFISMFAFGDFVQMQHEIHDEIVKSNNLLSRILDREPEKESYKSSYPKGIVKLDIDDEE